ncbi:MAG TPA: hypothetical protein VLT36_15765 [Candidatus Dormibacteraeota bacterium]|nr:hypothetical protein [Candidatus Dormibacteraeota bacterium]
MAPFRFHGPLCQTKDWYEDIEDGTMARIGSPLPSVVGNPAAAKPAKRTVAKGDCAFLNPQSRGTVHAPKTAFDRLRKSSPKATISKPTNKDSFNWPDGSTSPAIEQEIQIGNQTITVVRPTDDRAKGKNLPTMEQLAEALRAVPADQRGNSHTITLSPTAAPGSNPDEPTAGDAGDGKIALYPVKSAQNQEDFDNRLTHESGHNYAEKVWAGPEGVRAWVTAAKSDDRRPSPYAARDGEDFPEFLILYNAAKGTACEATAKAIYPNRWAKMDSY